MELGSIAKEGGTNMEEVVVTKGDTSPACMAEVSFLTPPPLFHNGISWSTLGLSSLDFLGYLGSDLTFL